MLAPLPRCERVFITICATLSFFSFCQWDVRSSRATIVEMLPSRSRNSAFSSGITNCRGTGPPRDLRTTIELRLAFTEPWILEFVNEKNGRQSTIRQLPHSFLMIFLSRRQSMLDTFMSTPRGCYYCLKNVRLVTGDGEALRESVSTFPLWGFRSFGFKWMGPPAHDVTNQIWTPTRRNHRVSLRPDIWHRDTPPWTRWRKKKKTRYCPFDLSITHAVSCTYSRMSWMNFKR